MPTRTPLSRDRVLRTALRLADETGVESLSMRKLAKQLGVEAMSLYNHVADKEDLISGIVDLVFEEIEPPDPDVEWRAAMRARAHSTREALLRHPWANGLLEARAQPGPANARLHEAVLKCLRHAGFSLPETVHAYSIQDSFIYGFALQERALPESFEDPEVSAQVAARQIAQVPSVDAYPYLAEMLTEHIAPHGYDYAAEFEFGLDLILDGLETRRLEAAGD